MDKSSYRYKDLIENGWKEVLEEDNRFFQLDHETLGANGSFEHKHRQMLKKYIEKTGLKKERPLKMDYQGYMNPFVGQEAISQNVVFGMDANVTAPSSVRGTSKGSRMLGLKQKGSPMGRGASSVSEKTVRGRGRKSDKLAKWAQ